MDRDGLMDPEQAKGSIWPYGALGSLFLAGALLVGAWNVEIPFLAYSAGPVSDANDLVRADGVPIYTPTGDLLMLTVTSQDVNLIEAMLAVFDPSIDLIRRHAVRAPDETDEEFRSRVLQQMDDSNFRSIVVALRHLGYEMTPVEVVIDRVIEGVPAVGVLEPGDTIVAVDGVEVSSVAEMAPIVQAKPPGATIAVSVLRDGDRVDLTVQLAERDDTPGVAMIGIILGEITEPPFPLRIHAGDIGGPSAGMMHTLAIIERLTQDDLSRGRVIAGTGTVAVDGTVGAIGGVRQKVVAAEAAGASHILVPRANYEDALSAPRNHIVIVPVDTIEDALAFLAALPPA